MGRYLIFAPQPYDSNGADRKHDYFGISQITGEYATPVAPAEVEVIAQVPEPGTPALLCIALAALLISRRRATPHFAKLTSMRF
jgi:hypothetical protein